MKGFTLIELLAVIVILAIILMIATPMVMGVIDSAKHSAARSSALMFVRQIEQQMMLADYGIPGQALVMVGNDLTETSVTVSESPTALGTAVTITAGVIGGKVVYQGYEFDITAGEVETTGTKL